MAITTLYKNTILQRIDPDGTFYFALGPANFGGAVTVTAVPLGFVDHPKYMEVIQTGMRRISPVGYGESFWLDIVVRNNSHASDPYPMIIDKFDVYTSVVSLR